jgi:hypothetical protein
MISYENDQWVVKAKSHKKLITLERFEFLHQALAYENEFVSPVPKGLVAKIKKVEKKKSPKK